jgi:hypothetical protein
MDLLELNNRGLIPGPGESEDDFYKRAASAKRTGSSETLDGFDANPDWVEVRYEKKGLLPWEGAATWIEEKGPERICRIQLKPSRIARLYPQEEVIAHEKVHAMRLMFDETRFEEILAFRTSKNGFRRYFGPLFSRPIEAKGLMGWLLGCWILYWAEMIFDLSLGADYLLWSTFLPLSFLIFRLARSQKTFSLALSQLQKVSDKPLAVALRLTDGEIEQFAKSSSEEIIAYIEKGKETNLRLRQIYPFFSLGSRGDPQ